MSNRERKYSWVSKDFDSWLKTEAARVRSKGVSIGTAETSDILFKKVIVPNQVKIDDLISIKPLKFKRKNVKR